jgi:hypothetical protein
VRASVNRLKPTTGKPVRRSRAVRKREDKRKHKGAAPKPPDRGHKANCISTSGKGNQPWNIIKMPIKRCNVKSLNVLTSKAWLKTSTAPVAVSYLPYIDRLGKFTGMSTYRCNLQPQSYISTVITTIHRRLHFWVVRKQSRSEYNKRQTLLLKCAAYYALSKNAYFWDRVLFLSKDLAKNWRTISRILHQYSQKLDDNKWFVYGHVCLQTQWLTSRALRPRDKSAFNGMKFMYTAQSRVDVHEIMSNDYDYLWHSYIGMSQL